MEKNVKSYYNYFNNGIKRYKNNTMLKENINYEGLFHEFLYVWLPQITRHDKVDDFIIKEYKHEKNKDPRLSITFFTNRYKYHISAVPTKVRSEKKDNSFTTFYSGYLGCIAQTRKPRAGEDWNRGNDLPDGKYCVETWSKIVKAIVAYELVKIIKSKKPKSDKIEYSVLSDK